MQSSIIYLTAALLFCLSISLTAQTKIQKNSNQPTHPYVKKALSIQNQKAFVGDEVIDGQKSSALPESGIDVTIGTTFYDLQTNNTMSPRIVFRSDGSLSTVWSGLFSQASSSW